MRTSTAVTRQTVERYWDAHFRRDWEAMAGFYAPDCHYTDVGIDATGATGPDEIIARLRLGLAELSGYYHFPKHMVAEGELVVTEHVEEWQFPTGEVVAHPFTSVMEVRNGQIARWHDYSHLANLLDAAPQWWLDHIAAGWRNGDDS